MSSPYAAALRYVGVHELNGRADHPLIQWWLSTCGFGLDAADEVPWCSAFVNGICFHEGLPRTNSARARSWLQIGSAVNPFEAVPGYDVVILSRGSGEQPGPDVIDAPGHVGFFAGYESLLDKVLVLGGNQTDGVCVAPFSFQTVLGVRRLPHA